jgi:hypothetical protein
MVILLAPAAAHKPAEMVTVGTFREAELSGVIRPAREGLAGDKRISQQLSGPERLGPSAERSFRLPD